MAQGVLNAEGGAVVSGISYGIYAVNGVQMNGGTVNATGGSADGEEGFCTVSFNSDGGADIDPVTIIKGGSLTSPSVPSKDEAVFIGWYDGDTPIDTDTVFTDDVALLARYETPSGNELENKDTTFTQTDVAPSLHPLRLNIIVITRGDSLNHQGMGNCKIMHVFKTLSSAVKAHTPPFFSTAAAMLFVPRP